MNTAIADYLNKLKPCTRRSYGWFLARLDVWSGERCINLEDMDASTFINFLEDQSTWKANSRRLATCAARAFFRSWKGENHPILTVKLHRVKAAPGRVLSPKKAIQLLAAINPATTSGARDLAMVMMMLDTGLREAEIARLSIQYLDLDERNVWVIVKGGEWERAVFSPATAEQVTRWLDLRKRLGGRYTATQQVFPNLHTGWAITPGGVRDIFERLSKRVGFTVSPHDLRRTFATISTKAGVPARVLMAGGRWHNMNQILTYTQSIDATDFDPYSPVRYLERALAAD